MKNTSLVIGASENPDRYSNMALKLLENTNRNAEAIGRRKGKVGNVPIQTGLPKLNHIHTFTLYISEKYQDEYIDYIINDVKPKRIIFNPGTENDSFYIKAKKDGIEAIEACTLVMIRTGQY